MSGELPRCVRATVQAINVKRAFPQLYMHAERVDGEYAVMLTMTGERRKVRLDQSDDNVRAEITDFARKGH